MIDTIAQGADLPQTSEMDTHLEAFEGNADKFVEAGSKCWSWGENTNPIDISELSTLSLGAVGEHLELAQRALAELGYNTSAYTGFDATMQNDVRNFQRNQGLTVDGVIGQGTWRALDESVNLTRLANNDPYIHCLPR